MTRRHATGRSVARLTPFRSRSATAPVEAGLVPAPTADLAHISRTSRSHRAHAGSRDAAGQVLRAAGLTGVSGGVIDERVATQAWRRRSQKERKKTALGIRY